jgi:hypothetical protein
MLQPHIAMLNTISSNHELLHKHTGKHNEIPIRKDAEYTGTVK